MYEQRYFRCVECCACYSSAKVALFRLRLHRLALQSTTSNSLPAMSLENKGQRWMIVRVLRKVKDLRKIANLRQAIVWWSGWSKGLPMGRIVIGARGRGVKLVVDAGERGQAKTTLDELQD